MANTGNTQQQINYGNTANDGQGDALRTAFIKTDDNFDAIWNTGPVGSNITILNNTVQANNTNGNIVIRPNGTGVIQANATILPNADSTRDLGSANLAWRRIYVDTATVSGNITGDYIFGNGAFLTGITSGGSSTYGNANVSNFLANGFGSNSITTTGNITADNLISTGNLYLSSNNVISGNMTCDDTRIRLAHTAANAEQANLGGIFMQGAVASLLYRADLDYWVANIGFNAPNVAVDNIMQADTVQAANVFTGVIENAFPVFINTNGSSWEFAGNILYGPEGGSWQDSADTLYIESPPNGYIHLHSVLNGNLVSDIEVEHSFIALNLTNGSSARFQFNADGTAEFPNYTFPAADGAAGQLLKTYGNGTLYWTTDSSDYGNANVVALGESGWSGNIIPSANATYSLGNATNYWSNLWVANNTIFIGGVPLGVTGNTLTVNGEAVLSNDSDSSITTTGNISAGNISVTGDIDANNYVYFRGGTLIGDETDGNIFRITSPLGYGVVIEADADIEGSNWQWTFDNNGTLGLPDKGSLYPSADDNAGLILLDTDSGNRAQLSAIGNVQLRSDSANAGYEWVFDTTGVLTAPGGITATGNVAGGNLTTSGQVVATGNITGGNMRATSYRNASGDSILGDFVFANNTLQTDNGDGGITLSIFGPDQADPPALIEKAWLFGNTGAFYSPGNVEAPKFVGNGLFNGTTSIEIPTANSNIYVGFGLVGSIEFNAEGVTALNLAATGNITGATANISGNISGANLITTGNVVGNVSGFAIGYRDIPQVSFTGNATIATTDAGKHFYSTQSTDYILTIANNASQGFAVGAAITIVNQGTGNITIAQDSGVTLYLAGNATSGNRNVTTFGMATIMKVATDTWFINGTGVV